jgi:hypothetical protein
VEVRVAARDHELTRREEVLERLLLGLPLPPPAGLPVGARELGGADRAPLPDALQHAPDLLGVGSEPGAGLLAAFQHETPVQAVVFDRDEAGRVRPVLEERPLGQKLVQPGRLVGAEPAPENQVRAARDDGYGVDLEHAHPADGLQHVVFRRGAFGRSIQALRR